MNIYLDIDGTLIHEDIEQMGKPASGLAEFIIALRPHDTFWLTTHCMDGDPERAQAILKRLLPEELHSDIDRIKPTTWSTQKTDAIDFTQEFIWLDDTLMDGEEKALREKATKDRQWFVRMDLTKNPEQLRDVISEYLT